MQHHLYADDTQLYVTFPPSEHTRAIERMEACVREVKMWLCDNGLVLNENKTEAIIIRSPNVRTPITMNRINICGQLVDTSAVIRDLGFVMDDHLSMASEVSNYVAAHIITCRVLLRYGIPLLPVCAQV